MTTSDNQTFDDLPLRFRRIKETLERIPRIRKVEFAEFSSTAHLHYQIHGLSQEHLGELVEYKSPTTHRVYVRAGHLGCVMPSLEIFNYLEDVVPQVVRRLGDIYDFLNLPLPKDLQDHFTAETCQKHLESLP